MKIDIEAKLTDVTDADLNNLEDALDGIDEACRAVKHQLTANLLLKAEAHRRYLERLIRFCHTGK
jgi:molybdenum cofactor biosynthesis enzyme MoaA